MEVYYMSRFDRQCTPSGPDWQIWTDEHVIGITLNQLTEALQAAAPAQEPLVDEDPEDEVVGVPGEDVGAELEDVGAELAAVELEDPLIPLAMLVHLLSG